MQLVWLLYTVLSLPERKHQPGSTYKGSSKTMNKLLSLGDQVRVYEDGYFVVACDDDVWYHRGTITMITADSVEVDFGDWVTLYNPDDFRETFINYSRILVPTTKGRVVTEFMKAA